MPRRDPALDATSLRRLAPVAVAAAFAALLGVGAWLLTQPAAPPPAAAAPDIASAPAFALQSGDEAAIAAHVGTGLTVFRFAAAPSLLVLDFPSLAEQGAMLNRVAALVEKAGLPRDRVLDDAELAAAIRARGDTAATFYYGHDYAGKALARFFALADRDGIRLDSDEQQLRRLLQQLGWLPAAPAQAGLISLSRAGADPGVTPAARAAILHHELSHGAFFTDAAYADHVRRFWLAGLRPDERAAVRRYLAEEGYDSGDDELMANEMQAYVMFTFDRAFFDPAAIGMAPARRQRLEAAFRDGMPQGWISAMPGALPAAACSSAAPCR